ncbi:GNAT family N-acetyltransferase (plasmid) [Haladaptatus sp. SPP-AMP-3]|uniref:GNAT family N-acetyltransferase n=1 Tax=Haladaptatus sp. SPP-AMP-3 TaxID=3121295 RepID=UPI003C2FB88C
MDIRPATVDDVDDIRRIVRSAWDDTYGFLSEREQEVAFEEWYGSDRLEAQLNADDAIVLVSAADSELVGFAYATTDIDPERVGESEIRSIYVAPDEWRAGVGSDLLTAIEDRVSDRGFTQLSAPIFAENEPGRAFFEANGFERIEERVVDLFTGGTCDAIVYYHQFSK